MRARDIDVGSGQIKGTPGYYMFYGMGPDGKSTIEEYHGRRSAMLMRRVDSAILTFHNAVVRNVRSISGAIEGFKERPFVQRVLEKVTGGRQSADIETDSISEVVDEVGAEFRMARMSETAEDEGQDFVPRP